MKKIFIQLCALAVLLTFSNCEEQENVVYDSINGQTLISFIGSSGVIPVNISGVSSTDINIEVSTSSSSDRTIEIIVDESSTAEGTQYSITDAIIPAGEYSATVTVTGVYSTLPETGSVDLVLKLTGVSDISDLAIDNDLYTVKLERFCPLIIDEFYGTYSQLSGFDGAAPSARDDATISAGPVDNTLLIENLHSNGRSGLIELDYSDVANPKVIHRSEEFEVVFATFSLGDTYTEDVLDDVDKNTFSTCNKEIRLFFYRRIAQPDGRYYGGSYEVILTKK